MIDLAMAYELTEAWLPDFLAYAENPHHPLAGDLLDRARDRIFQSYEDNAVEGHDVGDAPDDVVVMLMGVAEWITAQRSEVTA